MDEPVGVGEPVGLTLIKSRVVPFAMMVRIMLLLESATYTTPAVVSTATAAGKLKLADVPTPLDDPLVVLPASVDTV